MTPAPGTPGRGAVIRYVARHAVSWHVLHAYHRRGVAGAVEALGFCGGVGRDDDGVFRAWQTEAGGWRISYREGSTSAPFVRVTLREVLDHADSRFTAADRRRLVELVAARDASIIDAHPRDGWRSTAERHRAENARITAAQTVIRDVERQLRDLVAAALTDPGGVGEQLDLFAELGPE